MKRGFTVVELLIVIVVIGILATLTIIAYSGVQDNARRAALQSDLSQSAKKLEEYKFKNAETFPANLTAAQSAGVKSSTGNNLTYTAVNTASPATYCLEAINTAATYRVTGTIKTPQLGACGLTNLVANPSFESDTAGVGYNQAGTGTNTRITAAAKEGAYGYRHTFTAASSATGIGPYIQVYNLSPTKSYALRAWIRSSAVTNYRIVAERRDSSGAGLGTYADAATTLVPNEWTLLQLVVPPTPNMDRLTFTIYNSSGYSFAINDTVDYDGLMAVEGEGVPAYADGNSPGWSWTSTVNGSTSSGVAL